MKNKLRILYVVTFLVVGAFFITGCGNKSLTDAIKFKNEYESCNLKTRSRNGVSSDDVMRSVSIPDTNPMVYSSLDTINEMIANKETFIVYTGFRECPWCRSLMETMINTANELNIKKIYYVDIRPDDTDDSELRDIFKVNDNGEVILEHSGSDSYHTFIKSIDNVLSPYTYGGVDLTNTEWNGTKRLGAPNFILIDKGIAVENITGISDKQENGYQELDDEIKLDMKDKFTCLFKKYLDCDTKDTCQKEDMC